VDKLPQAPAQRVTHVVSLAGVSIIVMPALAFASAPWWVYFLVVGFVALIVAAFIRYPQLGLTGEHLLKYIQPTFGQKEDEKATNKAIQPAAIGQVDQPKFPGDNDQPLEARRLKEYEDNRGLFLAHYWEPSVKEGQKADIRVQLLAHRHPDGRKTPLEEGLVERVTYQLGPRFEEETVVKRNRKDNFALEFSLYSPVLCLAKVEFNDDTEPLYLSRYIDFPLVAGASAQILYNVEAPTPRWRQLWRRMFGR
jgi:hypothetical protein